MNNFIPNSFQIPNQIIDEFMPFLNEMELKFYLFIMRKTKGWQKESDGIAISQFLKGAKIKDERTVKKAIKGLLKKELIFQTYQKGSFSIFSINLNPNPLHVHEGSHADVPPTSSCDNPLHEDVGTPPSSVCTPQSTTNKNTKQSTTVSSSGKDDIFFTWIENKSVGKDNPSAYAAFISKQFNSGDQGLRDEFELFKRFQTLTKVTSTTGMLLKGKSIFTSNGIQQLLGAESCPEGFKIYFEEGGFAIVPSLENLPFYENVG